MDWAYNYLNKLLGIKYNSPVTYRCILKNRVSGWWSWQAVNPGTENCTMDSIQVLGFNDYGYWMVNLHEILKLSVLMRHTP